MDRPRSPVQDAGLWVRSIQPLWSWSPCWETRRAGPPPRTWERRPRSLTPIRLSVPAHAATLVSAARSAARRNLGLIAGSPIEPPFGGRRELRMFVVAMFHLLDVVMVEVIAVVADLLAVVDVVAAGDEGGAGHWPRAPSDPPGAPSFHRLSASARASLLCWTHYAHGPARPGNGYTESARWGMTHHALGRGQQWRRLE